MNTNAVNAFSREFEAYLTCLAETVEMITDEDWVTGATTRETPVHQACHCILPIVGYAGLDIDCARLSFRWKQPKAYPTRQELLDIISRISGSLGRYVTDVVDKTLAHREWSHPPLFKMIYLLRHSIWHLCCMSEELYRRGYKLPTYSKRYRPRS